LLVDQELQPPELTEEEAMEIAIDKSDLDDLAKWKGLVVQLRESAPLHGSLVTPPVTPSHS
jgi:hypothetical protein